MGGDSWAFGGRAGESQGAVPGCSSLGLPVGHRTQVPPWSSHSRCCPACREVMALFPSKAHPACAGGPRSWQSRCRRRTVPVCSRAGELEDIEPQAKLHSPVHPCTPTRGILHSSPGSKGFPTAQHTVWSLLAVGRPWVPAQHHVRVGPHCLRPLSLAGGCLLGVCMARALCFEWGPGL